MATGSGKTFTAGNFCYRLIKYAGARRILFLVDRNNLGDQTLTRVPAVRTARRRPQVHRDLQRPAPASRTRIDPVAKVVHHHDPAPLLDAPRRGARPEEAEEDSALRDAGATLAASRARSPTTRRSRSRPSTSSSSTSATARSTTSGGRCSTTSTPSSSASPPRPRSRPSASSTSNLVADYPHERAVADGVNVGYDVYRIHTAVTEQGGDVVDAGYFVPVRDRRTRARALRGARRRPDLHRQPARPLGRHAQTRSAPCSHLPRPAVHRDLPRPHGGAQDAGLRQGRPPRRGHRPDRPRGVRQGQRVLPRRSPTEHRREARRSCSRRFRNDLLPAHRRHGRHDRHRHRRQAAGVLLFMRDVKSASTSSR